MKYGDRIKESTTGTGTGALALAGAVSGFQTFAAHFTVGAHFSYVIAHQSAAEWECGIGAIDGGGNLVRFVVSESSNSNALVSFSAGTKHVGCTVISEYVSDVGFLHAQFRMLRVY